MVKRSGKVILQSGGRGKNILPGGSRKKKTCSVSFAPKSSTKRNKKIKNPKARVYCSNKVYGTGPKGRLCKKHFDSKKNGEKAHLYHAFTKEELEKIFVSHRSEYDVKISKKKSCSKCNNVIFKEDLCKKHFKNRFFGN
tara:strand:- start:98 stop:514 length:417 start_codon:yes stop_codon:yes gene_type:complete